MDDSLQMIMNPRRMSDEDPNDLAEVRVVGDGDSFDIDDIVNDDASDPETPDDYDNDVDDADDEPDDESDASADIDAGGGAPPAPPPRQAEPSAPSWGQGHGRSVSKEEIANTKRELLYRFDRLERKGVRLPRRYSMASDLTEMQADYDRLVRDRDADAGIKFQKKVLVAVVSGIEFLNKKFDPFDFHLDGWGETINENLEDYDDVLEELHAKYKGKAKMAPELKLLMMLIGSAFMYHLTNTMFKSMPALGQVVKDNPDLMKQFAAATANTMQKSGNDNTGMAGLFSGLFGGGGGGSAPPPPPPNAEPVPMKGPSSARVAEVQKFMQTQSAGVPRAAVRPPLPNPGRDAPVIKENPLPGTHKRPVDDDLLEIMSESDSVVSEVTSGGRRKRVLQL